MKKREFRSDMVCPHCKEKHAYSTVEEGRIFINCTTCGLHDYAKTAYNKKHHAD